MANGFASGGLNAAPHRGGAPGPPPPGFKVSGPGVNAVIVIIPATGGILPDDASIWLQRGGSTSGAVFHSVFSFAAGCSQSTEPAQTIFRFVNTPLHNNKLRDWIPSGGDTLGQGNVLSQLFSALGITINTTTNDPVITDVSNVTCMPLASSSLGTGVLSFQALIQFQSGG